MSSVELHWSVARGCEVHWLQFCGGEKLEKIQILDIIKCKKKILAVIFALNTCKHNKYNQQPYNWCLKITDKSEEEDEKNEEKNNLHLKKLPVFLPWPRSEGLAITIRHNLWCCWGESRVAMRQKESVKLIMYLRSPYVYRFWTPYIITNRGAD